MMNRRKWLQLSGLMGTGVLLSGKALAYHSLKLPHKIDLSKLAFGKNFKWGVACAAFQVEGAWNIDGKGPSIWDHFTHKKGNVANNEVADIATDFYHRYKEDIRLAKEMNFDVFRFSISWSRVFPNGTEKSNPAGVDFYHNVIDFCQQIGIEPWVTLYHWDLPQSLQDLGGWTNRNVIEWFTQYVSFCANEYGSKVKNWMIMNEPAAFVGLGYMLGYHAPGEKGVFKFLKATHHVCLAMAAGGRTIKTLYPEANVGTTFSCSHVDPISNSTKEIEAAKRIDALINRLFIEPSLGLGYPIDAIPALKRIEKYFEKGDRELLKFNFDFIGLQNYFRVVSKSSLSPPFLWAKEVPAKKRDVLMNEMNFEVYPEGIYKILMQFSKYEKIQKIIVTENGACFEDSVVNGEIVDSERIDFFKSYLSNVLKAKNAGVPVEGYFVWSLTDNFEWSEGYHPRFGLVHIDFETQKRTIKGSGKWFQKFLEF